MGLARHHTTTWSTIEAPPEPEKPKKPEKVVEPAKWLGQSGGKKGGKTRIDILTPEQRKALAAAR